MQDVAQLLLQVCKLLGSGLKSLAPFGSNDDLVVDDCKQGSGVALGENV